jgi:hypothetical protein
MAQKRRSCPDCGKRLPDSDLYAIEHFGASPLCASCRVNYESCSRCGQLRHLRDMRQVYCVDCRREYDRDRWARQRAARMGGG